MHILMRIRLSGEDSFSNARRNLQTCEPLIKCFTVFQPTQITYEDGNKHECPAHPKLSKA